MKWFVKLVWISLVTKTAFYEFWILLLDIFGQQEFKYELAACCDCLKGQPYPGLHQAQQGQLAEGRNCPALLLSSHTSSTVCTFGHQKIRKIYNYYRVSRGGLQRL